MSGVCDGGQIVAKCYIDIIKMLGSKDILPPTDATSRCLA